MSQTSLRATRSVVAEATHKVGEQRGNPRIFLSNKTLLRAGFSVGAYLSVIAAGPGTLVVERSEQPTTKCAHARGDLPCIDLNESIVADTLGYGGTVHVRIAEGQIVITRHPLDAVRADAERPRDGSFADVYAGAGLATEAATQAGLTPVWAVERDAETMHWHHENHPGARAVNMSAAEALVLPSLQRPEVLFGGVPCQPFSLLRTTTSAQTKRTADDLAGAHPLGGESLILLGMVAKLLPRTVCIENVRPYLQNDLAAGLQQALRQLGYHVSARVLDANDYGSVAGRPRAFIVAQTPDLDGTVPDPWPTPAMTRPRLGDVLDATVPDEAWVDPQTKPHLFARSAENAEKGRGFQLRGVTAEATRGPAISAEAGNGWKLDNFYIAHPTKPDTLRRPTLAETKRLMGVRDDFALPEGMTKAGELLGQGVYVPLVADLLRRASGREPSATRLQVAEDRRPRQRPAVTADLPLFG